MKKILGIGLVTAALLAGCGGSPAGTNQPTADTGAGTGLELTAVATLPADIGAEATTDPMAQPTTDALAEPTSATGDMAGTAIPTTDALAQPTSATGDMTGTAMPTTDALAQPTTDALAAPTSATGDTGGQAAGSTAITGYQPAGIPELGLSFQVPEGWEQISGENAWSPAGVDTPRVGVESADITPDWLPSSFLPEGAAVRSTQAVMLPGGQAMIYTVENTDGTAESHAIIRSGTTAYDFYARAESLQELQTFEPVLNDIVGSVQLGGV